MMDRRTFVSGVVFGLCATPLGAIGQPVGKVFRIGLLANTTMRPDAKFRQMPWFLALRDLGWVEGQNVAFERRASDGKAELLPGLARDLVAANVDLIATFGSTDAAAAKRATSVIPIVMIFSGLDPVEEGFVKSFARPGGNITGVSRMLGETDAKRLELIKEVLPATSLGVLAYVSSVDLEYGWEFDVQLGAQPGGHAALAWQASAWPAGWQEREAAQSPDFHPSDFPRP